VYSRIGEVFIIIVSATTKRHTKVDNALKLPELRDVRVGAASEAADFT
jgi:hypothetical protein